VLPALRDASGRTPVGDRIHGTVILEKLIAARIVVFPVCYIRPESSVLCSEEHTTDLVSSTAINIHLHPIYFVSLPSGPFSFSICDLNFVYIFGCPIRAT